MKQFRIYAATPLTSAHYLYELDTYASGVFGGFTRFVTTGGWQDKNGTVWIEPGVVYEIIADRGEVQEFANYVRAVLGQKQVLVTSTPIQVEWVE